MYKIGLFSQITKTTIKTLRYYDKVGIFKPEYIDSTTGYRYYTSSQLLLFHKISMYKQSGLTIREIKQILNGNDESSILCSRKKELNNILNETKKQISQIDYLLNKKKEGFFMEYNVIVKDLPECIVYYKDMVVPNYDSYFELIPAIGEAVTKANPTLKCSIPEYCYICYLENEYKEKDIHIEFCEAVEDFGNEVDGIKFKKLESVKAVCVMHKGAYKDLGKAYAYAFKWMAENGYELAQSPRESYIDGIWNKENEEDWLTEVQFPIKPI